MDAYHDHADRRQPKFGDCSGMTEAEGQASRRSKQKSTKNKKNPQIRSSAFIGSITDQSQNAQCEALGLQQLSKSNDDATKQQGTSQRCLANGSSFLCRK
jgi:hypothetical protein